MIIHTKKTYAIVLSEESTKVTVNDLQPMTIPEGHLVFIPGGEHIYFSSLNTRLVIHISHDVIVDYLNSINCDSIGFKPRVTPPLLPPVFVCYNRTPEIFKTASQYSSSETVDFCESQRIRFLIFTLLSNFLTNSEFILYLINVNRIRVSDRVRQLLNSDLKFDWSLNIVAKSLYLSSSILKKKLKSEKTSYGKILTNCRMHHAAKLLQTSEMNINQVSELCGYHNPSYFISVFKSFYGVTPCRFLKNISNQS